jgi:hypothetical protein
MHFCTSMTGSNRATRLALLATLDASVAVCKRTLRRLFLIDRAGPLRSLTLSIPLGPWMIDTSSADTSWPYYYDTNTDTAYERFLDGYWPMLRVRPCSRNLYKFSNDYTDTISLSLLSVTLSISSSSNRHTVARSRTAARRTMFTRARSRSTPSKIPVTHLPPWKQPFLRHNHRLSPGPS